ncbi:hypothetical protein NBRC116599_14670 [Aquicoccus sp. SU-CL01552]
MKLRVSGIGRLASSQAALRTERMPQRANLILVITEFPKRITGTRRRPLFARGAPCAIKVIRRAGNIPSEEKIK